MDTFHSTEAPALLRELTASMLPIARVTKYSERAGIYGVLFVGDEFPLLAPPVTAGTLVYITASPEHPAPRLRPVDLVRRRGHSGRA